MTTLNIYPAGKDQVPAYFEVVICESPAQFSEWEDDVTDDDYSFFLPNVTDAKNMERFATILFRADKLEDKIIIEQCSRAGQLFAEILTSIQSFDSDNERREYQISTTAEATQFMVNDIKNFIDKHYVHFPQLD